MFFRVRGNNVQLVKSVKQDDGKAKNVGAGSINLLTGKENLNDDVKLTQEDKAELAAFLDEHKEIKHFQSQLRAKSLDKEMQQLANDIQANRVSFSQKDVERMAYALNQIRMAVRKKEASQH